MKLTLLLVLSALALQAQTLHVFCSNGMRGAVEKLHLEKAAGGPVDFRYGTSTGLKAAIDKGEAFDVAILSSDLTDELVKAGKLKATTRTAIAKSGVGVGVRQGAKHPDISTADAMKQTLLNAKSLTYAREGASRPFLNKMYATLGITAQVEPKVALEVGSTQAAERVAKGQSEIILTLISEIKPVPGIELVGPLPREFQNFVSFAGATNPSSKNAGGPKLLKFLARQNKAFEAIGMQRP